MISKNIKDVLPNEVLGEDVYHDQLLLINKGTKLSKRTIAQLKNRNIEEVKITVDMSQEQIDPMQQTPNEISQLMEGEVSVADTCKADPTRDTFFQALSFVGYEYRYGKILNNDEDIQFLIQLFKDMHHDYELMDTLYALKEWNHYDFIHSFDVFILGTLVAKKLKLPHLEITALGFLFHDIGKLNIPQEILHKNGKLTYETFEWFKRHTMEGETILKNLGQHHIAHFARSHHERLDGSGYPDQLTRKELSKELNILQIIDVYASLTLKRAYKHALPAQAALQMLMQDEKRYDESILYSFIEALSIYPSHALVLLSDHTAATIKQVNKHVPTLPDIKRLDEDKVASLPLDFSVTVSKMIHFQATTFQARYLAFFNALMKGDNVACSEAFSYLIDDLKLEEIYTRIFLPAFWKSVKLFEHRKITAIEYNNSHDGLINLLEQLEQEISALNHYKLNALIIMEDQPTYQVPLKIVRGLLHCEYISPTVIQSTISKSDLKRYVMKNNVQDICVIYADDTAKHAYKYLRSNEMNISYKSYHELNQLFEDITAIENQSLKFYERLFDLSCTHVT